MDHRAHHSVLFEHPAARVWDVVRDFNSYPMWVNGVEESHLEEGQAGTTVGCVRNFSVGGFRTRQRLLAHSDIDQYFSYGGCDPIEVRTEGSTRTLDRYVGTLRIRPIVEGNRSIGEWSATYECPARDRVYWDSSWAESLPTWLNSLRDHLDGSGR